MTAATATFRVWRGDAQGGRFEDYPTPVSEGMVVLDAIHQIQATQANDLAVRWNCKAGKCGSCSAEVNGHPRLMCMTRLNELNLAEPVTVEPMRAFPQSGTCHRCVVEFRAKLSVKPFSPRPPDAPDGTWRMFRPTSSACGVPQVHRVFSLPGCVSRAARASHVRPVRRPRHLVYAAALEMHPLDARDRVREPGRARHRLLNITKCCTKVCPESITITDTRSSL